MVFNRNSSIFSYINLFGTKRLSLSVKTNWREP